MKAMLEKAKTCSGLTGDVSGLRGDVNECELTNAERQQGVDVSTLVK